MKTLIIEHVALTDLPAAWLAHLPLAPNTRVTVRIEEEQSEEQSEDQSEEQSETSPLTANPLFGMWKDREDIADVAVHARQLRAARYKLDGSGSEG
ncbi:MAG TPA: hypothetical protein VF800_16075 [Telluria sp.]|jgi:hypothetical protein